MAPPIVCCMRSPVSRSLLALLLSAAAVIACSGGKTTPTVRVATSTPTPAATLAPTATPAPSAALTPRPSPPQPTVSIVEDEAAIVMTDAMRFEPGDITVRAGRSITFRVENTGIAVHEIFVGTEVEQAEHATEMASGAGGHSHGNALTLDGGAAGILTMRFDEPGELLMACHEPGHYAAGMVGRVTVVD